MLEPIRIILVYWSFKAVIRRNTLFLDFINIDLKVNCHVDIVLCLRDVAFNNLGPPYVNVIQRVFKWLFWALKVGKMRLWMI